MIEGFYFIFSGLTIGIQESLNDLNANITIMDTTLSDLSKTFKIYEPIFQKAGLTYELAVRREVREQKGIPYARAFRVENFAGLARMSSPKDTDNELMPIRDCNTHRNSG
jgi:hypothetical protein